MLSLVFILCSLFFFLVFYYSASMSCVYHYHKKKRKKKKKLPESIESARFVSHRARTPGEFDSKKNSQSTKFKRRPQIFVKLSFRE